MDNKKESLFTEILRLASRSYFIYMDFKIIFCSLYKCLIYLLKVNVAKVNFI